MWLHSGVPSLIAKPPAAVYRFPVSRLIDIVVALASLALLSPLLILIATLVRVDLGRPVLFRQRRIGLGGRPFSLVKFRTMTHDDGVDGSEGSVDVDRDAERLTRLGRLLRKSSLDELPTLWNVLLGDMSLVGPRPLLVEYLPLYSREQRRRHDVRPGITGWAQVNGRNDLSWERKFELDVWYVDHRSLALDLRILLMTFARVLRADGINRSGSATTEKFRGADHE